MFNFNVFTNPGDYALKTPVGRAIYKGFFCLVTCPYKTLRNRHISHLSFHPDFAIPSDIGFLKLNPAAGEKLLPGLSSLLSKLRSHVDSGKASVSKGKSYLTQLLDLEECKKSEDLIRIALSPQLLGVAANYVGELPVLTSIKVLHSPAGHKDFSGSQLYHLDHDDTRQLKVFVYLYDVKSDSGPLTVFSAKDSVRVQRELGYRYGGKDGHVEDSVINKYLDRSKVVELTGPAGTVVLADTSRVFHFGSRTNAKDRYVLLFQYISNTSFLYNPIFQLPPICEVIPPHRKYPFAEVKISGLSKAQQAVLTGRM